MEVLRLSPWGRRRRDDGWKDPDWDYSSGWSGRDEVVRLPVTYSGIILGICVLFFVVKLVSPSFAFNYLALNPALVLERPWTILTHMFLHANFDHLLWNMIFLFFFGTELERRVGEKRFLQIYVISGLAAAFGQMLISTGFMMGASGALYGVMGCLAIIAPEIRVLLFFVIPLKIQYAVVLFALMDFTMMGAGDNIAHMAHLTGLVVGLAYGYSMRGRKRYYVT